jgi:hypothetical protein
MSYGWRERLKRAEVRLMEKLDLTQEDMDHIKENIGDYCHESDKQARLVFGKNADLDKKIEEMSEQDFEEMCEGIFKKIMKKLGYIKVKERKKKKKKKSAEQESEKESSNEKEEVPEERAEPQTVEATNES